jgi:hypothetical protein
LGGSVVPTAHVPRPFRFPWTLSVSDVIRTGWVPVFLTVMLKANVPPGSGRLAGSGVLETVMLGGAAVTVAISAGSPQAVPIGVLRASPE